MLSGYYEKELTEALASWPYHEEKEGLGIQETHGYTTNQNAEGSQVRVVFVVLLLLFQLDHERGMGFQWQRSGRMGCRLGEGEEKEKERKRER